jgi:hypothetical protein
MLEDCKEQVMQLWAFEDIFTAMRLVLLFELWPAMQWLQRPTPSQEEGLIT